MMLAGCNDAPVNNCFILKGQFDKAYTGTIYVRQVKESTENIDSIEIKSSTVFEMETAIPYTDEFTIKTVPYIGFSSFIGQNGGIYHLKFNSSEKSCQLNAEHASEQDIINSYNNMVLPYRKKNEALWKKYESAKQKSDIDSMKTLSDEMELLFTEERQKVKNLIKENKKSFAAVTLSHLLFLNKYPEFKEVYSILDTVAYAQTYSMRSLKQKMNEAKFVWMEGSKAPLFTTHDINGDEVKLEDFRGKYVLLDFWASWCHSCRVKAKAIKNIYPELEKRGIVMFGVSMDEKKKAWEKATAEDQICWTNTSELMRFEKNGIAQRYKVKQLPSLFLIDPDGKIVKQNPELEDLLNLPVKP